MTPSHILLKLLAWLPIYIYHSAFNYIPPHSYIALHIIFFACSAYVLHALHIFIPRNLHVCNVHYTSLHTWSYMRRKCPQHKSKELGVQSRPALQLFHIGNPIRPRRVRAFALQCLGSRDMPGTAQTMEVGRKWEKERWLRTHYKLE